MLAVRNLSVTVKKGGAMTMKTLESILALDDTIQKAGKVRRNYHYVPSYTLTYTC